MNRVVPLLLWLIAAAVPGPGQVQITEFMAANRGVLTDRDGYSGDWVELYNPGDTPVDLAGHYLSNDPKRRDAWRLPSLVVGAARLPHRLPQRQGPPPREPAPAHELPAVARGWGPAADRPPTGRRSCPA